MHDSTPRTRAEAREAKEAVAAALAGDAVTARTAVGGRLPRSPDVLGIGFGARETGGHVTEEPVVRVYVRAKLPSAQVPRELLVPPTVDGYGTDVVAVGDLAALVRPAPGGVSIGHVDVSAGTLGCLVTLVGHGDERFVLSNNHVLADSDLASVGDAVLQPAAVDGGTAADQLAVLHAAIPIDRDGPNLVDAAVARPLDQADVLPSVLTVGDVAGPPMPAAVYQGVRKHGRTTQHTVGVVVDVAADIRVRYGREVVDFVDQVAIVGAGSRFSDGGDSGSLVVDGVTRRPVGLLFAGGGDTTFCNPIDLVEEQLGARVVTTDPER